MKKGLLLIKRVVKYDYRKRNVWNDEDVKLSISCGIHRGGNLLKWE